MKGKNLTIYQKKIIEERRLNIYIIDMIVNY